MLKTLHKFIDIGANLTDPMFRGIYHGSKKHEDDFNLMLNRAWSSGLQKIIVTSGCMKDFEESIKLVNQHDQLYTTVGVHPTRCSEVDELGREEYLQRMEECVEGNREKVVAVGECGLDFDRLEFCPKDVQLKHLDLHFTLSCHHHLPLFLHCRNAAGDLLDALGRNRESIGSGGVVHSFDGTYDEAKQFLNLGLYIGINGCSLKTADNLDVVKRLPADRLLIETDSPWCEIKPTHASHKHVRTHIPSKKKEKFEMGFCVKGRNEPAFIGQILEVLASVRCEENVEEFAEQIYNNTVSLFHF